MEGIIVAFRVRKYTTHAKTYEFCKKFYGYVDMSNKCKYRYKRPGLLDAIPHIKLIRGVIIVRTTDRTKVVRFLKRYNAEIHVREINLTRKDKNMLGIK